MTVALASEIECFRDLVAERLGLHFEDDKLDFLAGVLRQRMEATRCDHFFSYQDRINRSASESEEMRAVAEQLTVCETYFFRYWDHFRAFTETVVPDRIRARERSRHLRILSAGCASGEEAYSVAMLIRDRLPDLASWDITILAIDVNTSMLEKAVRGQYTTWSLRETPANLRTTFFRADGRDFLLDGAVRSAVKFEERNLVKEDRLFWQSNAFDIVFCRNVTMYFTPEAARSVIARISRSLAPGGFLFMGHAETLRGTSQDFHLRQTHKTFYYQRREESEAPCTAVFQGPSAGNGSAETPIPEVLDPSDSWFSIIPASDSRLGLEAVRENSSLARQRFRTRP